MKQLKFISLAITFLILGTFLTFGLNQFTETTIMNRFIHDRNNYDETNILTNGTNLGRYNSTLLEKTNNNIINNTIKNKTLFGISNSSILNNNTFTDNISTEYKSIFGNLSINNISDTSNESKQLIFDVGTRTKTLSSSYSSPTTPMYSSFRTISDNNLTKIAVFGGGSLGNIYDVKIFNATFNGSMIIPSQNFTLPYVLLDDVITTNSATIPDFYIVDCNVFLNNSETYNNTWFISVHGDNNFVGYYVSDSNNTTTLKYTTSYYYEIRNFDLCFNLTFSGVINSSLFYFNVYIDNILNENSLIINNIINFNFTLLNNNNISFVVNTNENITWSNIFNIYYLQKLNILYNNYSTITVNTTTTYSDSALLRFRLTIANLSAITLHSIDVSLNNTAFQSYNTVFNDTFAFNTLKSKNFTDLQTITFRLNMSISSNTTLITYFETLEYYNDVSTLQLNQLFQLIPVLIVIVIAIAVVKVKKDNL